jgi:hypothetical protein
MGPEGRVKGDIRLSRHGYAAQHAMLCPIKLGEILMVGAVLLVERRADNSAV